MPVFHDIFSRSGRPAIMQTFSESVVYTNAAGTTRTINAVVIRETAITTDGASEVAISEVHVVNDSVLGITGTDINPGNDTLTFTLRPGGGVSTETRTIQKLLSIDEGMLVLQCY